MGDEISLSTFDSRFLPECQRSISWKLTSRFHVVRLSGDHDNIKPLSTLYLLPSNKSLLGTEEMGNEISLSTFAARFLPESQRSVSLKLTFRFPVVRFCGEGERETDSLDDKWTQVESLQGRNTPGILNFRDLFLPMLKLFAAENRADYLIEHLKHMNISIELKKIWIEPNTYAHMRMSRCLFRLRG
ncbi:hypothetical protein HNY73_000569 [Argiope bruennichi]|uniref:Uncharacterized protein n=1 Tax=Argiope bruennichi TaxID=94029 RepID=A0A8T0G0Y3_ARGBR|nr:hypothetical protein HNY73_000569 [Argiope bruennichi]